MNPMVSVVIPTFNSAWSLQVAIESVLSQDFEDLEIIIVDDGSSDKTAELVANFSRERVNYFFQVNAGVSVARNHGILHSRGKYIAFLDADDFWFPGKLRQQVALMEQQPEIVACYTDFCHTDSNGTRGDTKRVSDRVRSSSTYYDLLQNNFINTSTLLVRRSALAASGIFAAQLKGSEDYDLWLRLARYGEFGCVSDVLATYRKHDQNTTKTTVFYRHQAGFQEQLWQDCQHDPKAVRLLKPKVARVLRKLGDKEWQDGRYREARRAFIKSVRFGNYRFKSLLRILASFLPAFFIGASSSPTTAPPPSHAKVESR